MTRFEESLLKTKANKQTIKDGYEVRFLAEKVMDNYFGYAFDDKVFICEGLSTRVEQFVIAHEKYHLNDRHTWLGWIGSEGRANLYCGVRDPIGLFSTIIASVKKGWLPLYWNLLKSRGYKQA